MSTKTLFYSLILFSTLVVCDPPDIKCSDSIKYSPGYTCPKEAKLGSGASAIAFKVLDAQGKPALMKVQKVEEPQRRDNALREVSILQKCDHPNVIKIFSNFEKNNLMYTVLEIGELGSLEKLIRQQADAFNDALFVLDMFKQLLAGTQHIHSKDYAHADLKTGNVVVASGYVPKIIDFDLAVDLNTFQSRRGTPLYMDPNIILASGDIKFDATPDIYSLGIILYEMTHQGITPFEGLSIDRIVKKIIAGTFEVVEGTDLMVAYLISRCTLINKNDRLSIQEMINLIDGYFASFSDQKVQKTTINMNVKMDINDFKLFGMQKVTDIPLGNALKYGMGANNKYGTKGTDLPKGPAKGLDIPKGPIKAIDIPKEQPKGLDIPKGPVKAVEMDLGFGAQKFAKPTPLDVENMITADIQKKLAQNANVLPAWKQDEPTNYDFKKIPTGKIPDYKPYEPTDFAKLGIKVDNNIPPTGYTPSTTNNYQTPGYTPGLTNNAYQTPGYTPAETNNIYQTPGYTPLRTKGLVRKPTGYKGGEDDQFRRDPEMKFNILNMKPTPDADPRDSLAYIENPEVKELVRKYRKKQRALGDQKTANEDGLYNRPIELEGSDNFGVWVILTFFSLAISIPFAAFLGKRMVTMWTKPESVPAPAPATTQAAPTPAAPIHGGISVSIKN